MFKEGLCLRVGVAKARRCRGHTLAVTLVRGFHHPHWVRTADSERVKRLNLRGVVTEENSGEVTEDGENREQVWRCCSSVW